MRPVDSAVAEAEAEALALAAAQVKRRLSDLASENA